MTGGKYAPPAPLVLVSFPQGDERAEKRSARANGGSDDGRHGASQCDSQRPRLGTMPHARSGGRRSQSWTVPAPPQQLLAHGSNERSGRTASIRVGSPAVAGRDGVKLAMSQGETIDPDGGPETRERRPGPPLRAKEPDPRGVPLKRAEGDVGPAIPLPGAMGLTACSDSGTSHPKMS